MGEHRSISEVLKKAEHDAALHEALRAARTAEEVVEAASAAGFAVSVEEVQAFRADVRANPRRAGDGALNDAELISVAGGSNTPEVFLSMKWPRGPRM